ncbi:MAG TPA: hypothetical protein VEL74_22030 [Thermoanaerobaculia bacterium]|nr:hypothetical protein [Thermoanaerobaculia bacterium]
MAGGMAGGGSPLLDQIRSGANRQLQVMAASGLLPLPPEEIIPLQVELAGGTDFELALRAKESLRSVDPRVAVPYLAKTAGEEVLFFFALEATQHPVIEALLRRRDVPRQALEVLAKRVPPDLQEILILRQDAIVESPAILDALEENPELSAYTQRRISEYRQHLLPRERTPAGPAPVHAPGEIEECDDATLAREIAAVRSKPVDGEVEERTGLSEGQIRMLPVPARLKLARGAPRLLRSMLMRDSNVQVALAVLRHNTLSDQEVEMVASSRAVVEDVLIEVSKRREWVGKYNIAKALVQNPRCPLPTALRLLSRMSVRDLREIARDRNVPDAVRSTALRLYTIKQK